jgi:hypothetical protein
MALPVSGPLSLSQIQTEFGGSNPISMSEYYRGGAYVTTNNTNVPTSGTIKISDFYNAVKQFAFTISSNYSSPQNLRSLALAAGWNGDDPVLATNTAIISSNTTGTAALTINGSFPRGVIFVNNGTVVGMGGVGGLGGGDLGYAPGPQPGGAGGTAISVSTAVSINNGSGTIAGGGGGGGGGAQGGAGGVLGGGGGGGGGRTGLTNSGAGGGGSARVPGGAGSQGTYSSAGGGGGAGRPPYGGAGGTGGGWGSAGSNGAIGIDPPYQSSGAGGAAGNAITGNSNITWIATGTRLGPIS